ncbi:hypothetical protein [Plebeiibacterium sediminum]|uniref:Uncharacterized protein n=1 Tax=Plebeiibacterium sediminum TaxID=2992112 RepID=A0AAE3M4N9_9BACT|nr:hypothetical protein [Plebeiobacterium sediminum]MCW3786834.1 hypothetical protein [Plebeiobacterium sediminum]
MKSLQSGYIETNDYPELLTKQGQDFLNLMQQATAEDNNKNKKDGNYTIN